VQIIYRVVSYCVVFSDVRDFLVMSLPQRTTWPTWRLRLSKMNNIMYGMQLKHSTVLKQWEKC